MKSLAVIGGIGGITAAGPVWRMHGDRALWRRRARRPLPADTIRSLAGPDAHRGQNRSGEAPAHPQLQRWCEARTEFLGPGRDVACKLQGLGLTEGRLASSFAWRVGFAESCPPERCGKVS